MIPEDAFCVPPWSRDAIGSDEGEMLLELWAGLAACFGATRVARKAKIDSGPKRESRVRLLLPPVGLPETTGPETAGWVAVLENGIQFNFDITRVMFCSGNCTERMRMGRVDAAGQCIVDLYSGVGYYTLPFLVHAKAAVVHACEWNENSVQALRANLAAAGQESKCVVYNGDNRNEDTVLALSGIADRVCLGLLPSSVEGWPLAASALKSTGGILHVHENVGVADIDEWVISLCRKFEELFRSAGKDLTVSCSHLEKVKSYAPKIFHVVADLTCHL